MTVANADAPREKLGPYTLVRKIGEDSIAEAWVATAPGPRTVILKRIAARGAKELTPTGAPPTRLFVETFLAEAAAIASLDHPNIVPVTDFGVEDNVGYLTFGYAPGRTVASLASEISDDGGPIALYIAAQVCKGLDFALRHAERDGKRLEVSHRAISPEKIHVSYAGDVRIADFGLAKIAHMLPRTSGPLLGDPRYMSPEQIDGNALDLDARTDVFSLAVVLLEMLTGTPLFTGTPSEIQHQVSTFRFPDAKVAALPEDVRALLRNALARDRTLRIQSPAELQLAIESVLGAVGIEHARASLAKRMEALKPEEAPKRPDPVPEPLYDGPLVAPAPARPEKPPPLLGRKFWIALAIAAALGPILLAIVAIAAWLGLRTH